MSWPLPLEATLPCAPGCGREEAARAALERGVRWLAAHTLDAEDQRYDVPIALAQIRRSWTSPLLDAELARLVEALDDGGDPRRRLWEPSARLPELPAWTPVQGQEESPNRALVEALYCPEHGFRPEVASWLCSTLRDGGGVKSAHAAWIEAMAVEQGCLARRDTCLDALRDELVAAANDDRPRDTTLQRDELGEQVLFAVRAGAPAGAVQHGVDRLLAAQSPEGAFGTSAPGEDPSWTVHATLVGSWALATWVRAALGP